MIRQRAERIQIGLIGGINSNSVQQGVSTKNTLDALNGLAVLDGTIEEGATVTSIPVKALAAGYWKSGDTVTVFNPNSGNSQVFTVSADTSASDTSISVTSVAATETFYPGANIMVTVTDKISNATGPYIKKYADDTVEANTLWETDQQVQFGSTSFFQTLDSGVLFGLTALVRKSFITIRDIFGTSSGNGWSAGTYNGGLFRKGLEAVMDGSGNVIAKLYHGANTLIAQTISTGLKLEVDKRLSFNGSSTIHYDNSASEGIWEVPTGADMRGKINGVTQWYCDTSGFYGVGPQVYVGGQLRVISTSQFDAAVTFNGTTQHNESANFASTKGITFNSGDLFDTYLSGTSGAVTASRGTISGSANTLEYLRHGNFVTLSGQLVLTTAGTTGLAERLSITLPRAVKAGTVVSGQLSLFSSGGALKRIMVQEDRYVAASTSLFNNVSFITNLAAATVFLDTDTANGDLLNWTINYVST